VSPINWFRDDIQVLPGLFVPHTYGREPPVDPGQGDRAALCHATISPALHGALEASYRFYADTYGIVGHTLDLAWYQHIATR